jgi:predicted aspartyl protease
MRKLATIAAAVLSLTGGAEAAKLQVQANDGYMNIRSGPGTNFALIGSVPNGTVYNWPGEPNCVARQDGIRGADWCKVNHNGTAGWVSRSGLMPVYDGEPPRQFGQDTSPDYDPQPQQDALVCDRPQVLIGDDPRDTNPVTWIEVTYSPADHAWRIFHHQQNGGVVSRSEQYALVDNTSANKVQWSGSLNRNRSLFMVGEVKPDGYYYEWLYNRSQGNRLDMQLRSKCHVPAAPLPRPTSEVAPPMPERKVATAVTREPPQAAPIPQVQAAPRKDSVPLYTSHGGERLYIDALVGGNPVRMLLDTGAQVMQISSALAAKIVLEQQGSFGGMGNFVMADGRTIKQQVIFIESVRIGNHVVRNVRASVSDDATPLMSFPVLNAIGAFKIDARSNELVFETKVEAKG